MTNQKKRNDKVQITHAANFAAVSMKKGKRRSINFRKGKSQQGA
jgi:hypothetical protein